MHFITPYLLTYFCFFSFTYLVSMLAFIHQHICDLYQITKIQLGFGNAVMALLTTLGVLPFLMYTVQIKAKIVTFFTWGSIGLMISYLILVIASLAFDQAPKILFYLQMAMIGFFKSMFIQSILIMIRMHKEIYDQTNLVSQRNYKILTNIWSAGYGISAGFFVCNWLQYTLKLRWQLLVLIGVSLKLVTTTLLFFGLRSYLETDENDDQVKRNVTLNSKSSSLTLLSFFTLLNEHLPSKLFLINSTLLDGINIGFCFVLPVFFYSMGYKGNQGFLTAIYNLAMVAGAYTLAISDYLISYNAEENCDQDKKQKQKPKQSAKFMFIFSVSLFFFVVTLFVLTILSFQIEQNHQNQVIQNTAVNMFVIIMCALGFFLGGPYKEYFSYKAIKSMIDLQIEFKNRMKTDQIFRQEEQWETKFGQLQNSSFRQKIKGRKLEVGSSLITIGRILTYFTTFVIFVVSFYLVDQYLPYTMILFLLIGVSGLLLDVVQNLIAIKKQKEDNASKKLDVCQNY